MFVEIKYNTSFSTNDEKVNIFFSNMFDHVYIKCHRREGSDRIYTGTKAIFSTTS